MIVWEYNNQSTWVQRILRPSHHVYEDMIWTLSVYLEKVFVVKFDLWASFSILVISMGSGWSCTGEDLRVILTKVVKKLTKTHNAATMDTSTSYTLS